MTIWPLHRRWSCLVGPNRTQILATSDLASIPACVLLGFAGSGKTHELDILACADQEQGRVVSKHRLLTNAESGDSLRGFLKDRSDKADATAALYLDGLDELLVQVPTAAAVLANWVRESVTGRGLAIRITCRTAVWQEVLQDALRDTFGKEELIVARLEPFTSEDLEIIAAAEHIDAVRFQAEIKRVGAESLAQQPLTVRLLVDVFRENDALPEGRWSLMQRGVAFLARERREREKLGGASSIPVGRVLRLARPLACIGVLTGRDVIDLRDDAGSGSLGREELGTAFDGEFDDLSGTLTAVGRSGLCEGEGEDRFRFFHRQIAEYLASCVIAELPLHQAQAFLRRRVDGRDCIAGPLRETAAFAAMGSPDLAKWISAIDPEVIGMSEVADSELKRRAAFGLLDAFRQGIYTDSQVRTAGIDWRGFRHPALTDDLLRIIERRHCENDDVLCAAIAMIEACELAGAADGLADLAMDESVAFYPRVSAAHAVYRMDIDDAKKRLKPLAFGSPADKDHDLRGIALYCNWPENLTTTELFEALDVLPPQGYIGRYDSFLESLVSDGFDARSNPRAGLGWAIGIARSGKTHSSAWRLMQRICLGSLHHLDDQETADLLAKVMLVAMQHYDASPLEPLERLAPSVATNSKQDSVFCSVSDQHRYGLIHAIAANAKESDALYWVYTSTPGIIRDTDFAWLLTQAMNSHRSHSAKEAYAELASAIHWRDVSEHVDAWLAVWDREPVVSKLPGRLVTRLGSPEAAKAIAYHQKIEAFRERGRSRSAPTNPHEQIDQLLEVCQVDPSYFPQICLHVNRERPDDQKSFSRDIHRSVRWRKATPELRSQILDAATEYLKADVEQCSGSDAHEIAYRNPGAFVAIWLLLEQSDSWLSARPEGWWAERAEYLLRQLNPGMQGEANESKWPVLRVLHEKAGTAFRNSVVRLAESDESDPPWILRQVFSCFSGNLDGALITKMIASLQSNRIPAQHCRTIAMLLLRADQAAAGDACEALLDQSRPGFDRSLAFESCMALAAVVPDSGWGPLVELLKQQQPDDGNLLQRFARAIDWHSDEDDTPSLDTLPSHLLGEVLMYYFDLYHGVFESEADDDDPESGEIVDDERMDHFLHRLLNVTSGRGDAESVQALRDLEARHAQAYPWLRRPRAKAERNHRMANWQPHELFAIAKVLKSNGKRLIIDEVDALDGIEAGLKAYEDRLHHSAPREVDDLWDTPSGQEPSPKNEERVSDKICAAVQDYFTKYAVTANREVQIRKRVRKGGAGSPGSKLDVLVDIPGLGTVGSDPIRLPIEVKLSHNQDAKSAMETQLVGRYVSELGTNCGVYVVVWMGEPGGTRRPRWKSIDEAKADLARQALDLMNSSEDYLHLRTVVIDGSLPRPKN